MLLDAIVAFFAAVGAMFIGLRLFFAWFSPLGKRDARVTLIVRMDKPPAALVVRVMAFWRSLMLPGAMLALLVEGEADEARDREGRRP